MKPELEKILVEKYPKLLINYNGDRKVTCMAWGLECGDGWFKILDHLFGYLTKLMETPISTRYTVEYRDAHHEDKDFFKLYFSYKCKPLQIALDQVKEKFGCLRVYYHTVQEEEIPEDIWAILDLDEYYQNIEEYNNKIDNAIDYAEYQSSITCEVTGKEGKLYQTGWHRVLCDEEAMKQGYKLE